MPTAEKAQTIDELAQLLQDSQGAVILDYRGLNVKDISALRNELRQQDVEFHVAKNTLLRIAAERANVTIAPDQLTGPTAVAFGMQSEVAPAKLLTDFVRRNRAVSIKGGVVSGRPMTAEQIGQVAELPSREELFAKLLGALQAPMAQTLGVLQAPAREIAGLAQALAEKREAA
ncbi:MAG TPA: 50S ribosomal protein L10 [Chloroflexota bacterium]|nr:50S ribosomal protein L10 [Chloroflexota bacterium]